VAHNVRVVGAGSGVAVVAGVCQDSFAGCRIVEIGNCRRQLKQFRFRRQRSEGRAAVGQPLAGVDDLCQDTLRTGRSLPRHAQDRSFFAKTRSSRSFFAKTRSGRVQGRLEFKKQWVRSVPPAQLASSAELPLAVEAHVGLQSCPILRHASCEKRPSFLGHGIFLCLSRACLAKNVVSLQ
jgi:hypothetical protein